MFDFNILSDWKYILLIVVILIIIKHKLIKVFLFEVMKWFPPLVTLLLVNNFLFENKDFSDDSAFIFYFVTLLIIFAFYFLHVSFRGSRFFEEVLTKHLPLIYGKEKWRSPLLLFSIFIIFIFFPLFWTSNNYLGSSIILTNIITFLSGVFVFSYIFILEKLFPSMKGTKAKFQDMTGRLTSLFLMSIIIVFLIGVIGLIYITI